jgi:hypothetical protein
MPDRACLHCGEDGFPNRDALWYHVPRCPKNPNPACEKCGLRFVPARIVGHRERCGSWNEKAEASAPPAAPAKPEEGAARLGVPADHLTPTDEMIIPLLASPEEKPAPPAPASKREPKGREIAEEEDRAGEEEDAGDVEEEEPEGGLSGAFEKRDPPRTAAFQGFASTIKANWVLLAFIAAVLVVVIVLRRISKEDAAERAAPAQAAMPPPVQFRPPYNPEIHGSIESYRATFGHLPNPGGN